MVTDKDIVAISDVVNNDGVICYPTEAVWGLGCHPQSHKAFEKLLSIKKRSIDKGVILIASDYEQLAQYVCVNARLSQCLEHVWPGFVTCVLPKSDDCPDYLCGKHDSIAVRLTTHPTVTALCHALDSPLVSTSANLSGYQTVKNVTEARDVFGEAVDFYVDAELGKEQKPSRIVSFNEQEMVIIRE